MSLKLVAGCGYLGFRVAQQWIATGSTVYAITRTAHRAAQLEQVGIRPIVADVTQPDTLCDLPKVNTVLVALGHDRNSSYSIGDLHVQGLGHLLDALAGGWHRLVYISSTSVYGQQLGEWVDETSPTNPVTAGGRACLEAERLLESLPSWPRTVILRLAGIYGPGRVPRPAQPPSAQIVAASTERFINLIHIDDAVQIVVAAEQRLMPPDRLVVSDGHPTPRNEYVQWLAARAGSHQTGPSETPSHRQGTRRGMSNKRVSNRRMLDQLGTKLQFPTYRHGLATLVEGPDQPG